MVTVTANSGSFEIRFGADSDGMRFEPTHDGLVAMAGVLEAMVALGSERVYILPSISRPDVTGLPPDYDARGFVQTAYTLSRLGLGSQPGGTA